MTLARFKRVLLAIVLLPAFWAAAEAKPVTILAFGTSLTQGYGLPPGTEYPVVLEARLRQAGIDAHVINAGVSGDTSSDGLSRLDWTLSDPCDAVILEVGSNDALRGIDPALTKKNIAAMLQTLNSRHIPVLLVGMKAPRNLGPDYDKAFDAIYPALCRQYGVLFYPFMLDGVALNPKLNQADGLHPNPQGVEVIVSRMLPDVEKLLHEADHKP